MQRVYLATCGSAGSERFWQEWVFSTAVYVYLGFISNGGAFTQTRNHTQHGGGVVMQPALFPHTSPVAVSEGAYCVKAVFRLPTGRPRSLAAVGAVPAGPSDFSDALAQ